MPHISRKLKKIPFIWEWNVAQPTQDSGGGWAANKPVGSLGMTPTTSQKWLMGQTVNLTMTGNIKRL